MGTGVPQLSCGRRPPAPWRAELLACCSPFTFTPSIFSALPAPVLAGSGLAIAVFVLICPVGTCRACSCPVRASGAPGVLLGLLGAGRGIPPHATWGLAPKSAPGVKSPLGLVAIESEQAGGSLR